MQNPSSSGKQEGIHVIRPGEVNVVDGIVEVTCYGWGGVEVATTDPDALAKKIYDPATGRTSFWLKRATAGPDAGKLFNPQSPTFNADTAKRVHNEMGRGRYEFRKVTPEAFELYLRFIRTGNPVHVRNAERFF